MEIEKAIKILDYIAASMLDDVERGGAKELQAYEVMMMAMLALQEKLEREHPKSLITNDGLEIMLCPNCKIDLMGEFSESDGQEKFCPYCGGAVDFNHAVNDFVDANKNEHIGEATNMVEGE